MSLESKSSSFVNQFAERIPIEKLKTLIILSKRFRKKTGFYFLYDGNTLYYVGIGNIIQRLKSHAYVDKHKGKWNYFSFYITENIDHAKEIEAIIQRSTQLEGNIKTGKLRNSKDLTESINTFDSILEDFK